MWNLSYIISLFHFSFCLVSIFTFKAVHLGKAPDVACTPNRCKVLFLSLAMGPFVIKYFSSLCYNCDLLSCYRNHYHFCRIAFKLIHAFLFIEIRFFRLSCFCIVLNSYNFLNITRRLFSGTNGAVSFRRAHQESILYSCSSTRQLSLLFLKWK